MNNLTPREKKIFNNVTRVISKSVSLGDKFQELIESIIVKGTAVNAVPATGTLTVSGAVSHGESVTIDNPAEEGEDLYVFDASGVEGLVIPGKIVVDISDYTTAATGTLTVDVQPTAADTFTIGEKTYKFVAVGAAKEDGDVSVGADLDGAQAAIVAAVKGTDGINKPHPLVTISAFVTDVATVTALIGGTAGNAVATTETFTAGTNVFSGAVLASGANSSAANAITAFVAAVTNKGTQMVGATGTSSAVTITANIGIAGNDIETTEDMANGAFADDTLQNGVSGTQGREGSLMVDNSYLYVAIADNTLGGANWRRISVGSAF